MKERNAPGHKHSGLELRIPTEAELRAAYREDLEAAFPPDELKPLSAILRPWRAGTYQPWCLYDGGSGPVGECFLWLRSPGCALLDYLCVSSGRRNDGLGSWMLDAMTRLSDWTCILGECEAPEYASDPALAARRMEFYFRSGARLAGYDTELFGVRYRTLYWAGCPLGDDALAAEHRKIYRLDEMPERIRNLFQIPCPEDTDGTGARAEAVRTALESLRAEAESQKMMGHREEADEPGETDKQAKAGKPTETGKQAKAGKPTEADKWKEADAPAETGKTGKTAGRESRGDAKGGSNENTGL